MITHLSPRRVIARGFTAPLLVLSACGGDSIQGPEAGSGSIRVTVQTAAATAEAALDLDGYVISVRDFGDRPVEPGGKVTFTGVPPGVHVVDLQGMQVNCTSPGDPTWTTVVAGGTAQVSFQVTCWPPTTGRIAFNSNRSGVTELYTMNADGTDVVRVVENGWWPAWSPDGWKIAFTRNLGSGTVYVVNADGSGLTEVASQRQNVSVASWSPDGSRIAFAEVDPTAGGAEDIMVVDADGGGNVRRLTRDPARDFSPAWSPDGSKIAFVSDRDGNEEIYLMNADGSDPVNLTDNLASDAVWAGGWSPDGTRIVFSTDRHGHSDIYVMNADGSNPVRLTDSPFNEHGGSWSPDGTKVVFWQGPAVNIFIINADGTGMVDITNNGDVLDRYPNWSRGTGVIGVEARSALSPPWSR